MTGANLCRTFAAWLIVLSVWAVMHGAMALKVDPRVLEGRLTGPDEYMRLVRVAELRDGSGWYDTVIERSNAPYGDTLHWTRPMDFLILSGAYALSPVLGPDDALFVSGAAVSPLLALLIGIAVAWGFLPLLGKERAVLAAILVLIQPALLAYTAAGRADHHGLLFLLFVLAIGGTVRIFSSRQAAGPAVLTGAAYGAAVWVSVESILLVALCQAVFAIAWIRFRDFSARAPLIAAGAFLATTMLALVSEHSPNAIFAVEPDRLSFPHGVIAAIVFAAWGLAWSAERRGRGVDGPAPRAALLLAAGLTGGLVLIAAFPDVADPLSKADPRILRVWEASVGELGSLVPTDLDKASKFLYFIGAAVPCLVYAVIAAWRQRRDARSLPWMLVALLLAAYFALSLRHVRIAPYAEILSAPVLAEMTGRLLDWYGRQRKRIPALLVACSAIFALTAGGLVSGLYLLSLSTPADAAAPDPQCRISRISPLLNDPVGLGATPLTIAAMLDHGPEILYRTRHAVVGAPYHRNGPGIWDSYRVFASRDEAESRGIVTRRGIGLLLVCPARAELKFFTQETGQDNLYTRLTQGALPPWLAPVPVEPDLADGFRIYRVIR